MTIYEVLSFKEKYTTIYLRIISSAHQQYVRKKAKIKIYYGTRKNNKGMQKNR